MKRESTPLTLSGRVASRRSRERGELDSVDLLVGVVLLVLVPGLCYVIGSAFIPTKSEDFLFRQKPEIPPPPVSADEVELRFSTFRDLYEKRAKDYLDTVKNVEDGVLKEHHRKWAKVCLINAGEGLKDLAADIVADDETRGRFARKVTEIASYRKRIQNDVKYAESLDTLKLDTRSRGLSERDFLQQ